MALVNQRTGQMMARRITRCDTLLKRARGLMFRPTLPDDEAYLFVEARESIAMTTIHMLFVFFPIGVFWLDNDQRVVHKTLARPFRLFYAPSQPARYFVECSPAVLDKAQVGDRLSFE